MREVQLSVHAMSPQSFRFSSRLGRDWRRRHLALLGLAICLASANGLTVAAPLWFGNEGPTAAARQALDVLANAAADGLDAKDYPVERLREAIKTAGPVSPANEERIARADQALTATMIRYINDLRGGRLEGRQMPGNYRRSTEFNAEAWLQAAVAGNRVAEAVRAAAPDAPQYAGLRDALARYRELIGKEAWQKNLPPLPGGRLTPGQAYADLPRLTQRLIQLGDLPAGNTPPKHYEGALVEGVKSFQERHALTADGVIGNSTLVELNVQPETRVRQIELALERLRWTPLPQNRRNIVVNIPEFTLRAYGLRDGKIEPAVSMRVIVGKAGKTRTPLFDTDMRVIEFSPNWNVPPSIAKGETLPRLRRDPTYFSRAGLEFVGSDGKVVAGFSDTSLAAVERGQMRIRQRPSAGNALGQIKFVLPNSNAIYLHHTASPQLFKRDRRDFSHGCIRIEAPVDLARFVLADEPEWTRERIVKAMGRGKSSTASLREPLPVVIAYNTTVLKEGKLYFFRDIYGLDKALDNALRARSQVVRASSQSEIAAKSRA